MTLSPKERPVLAPGRDCTGCGACANACPADSITLSPNSEGFNNPVVSIETCRECGACTRKCPVLNDKDYTAHTALSEPKCYSGWIRDGKIRRQSSSGGIFTALAGHVINQGGKVYGAVMKSPTNVRHIRIGSIDGLKQLRGSKYIQSHTGSTFREVKQDLTAGLQVLYSGTPCQIGGLLSYLKKPFPNLITCDVVCHGVPGIRLFERYCAFHEKKDEGGLVSVDFRNKATEWRNFQVVRHYRSGLKEGTPHGDDLFMRGFLSDLNLNPACYQCRFTGIPRTADITLADFWGSHVLHPGRNDSEGISLIIANTAEGVEIMEAIRPACELFEESLDKAAAYNPAILRPFPEPRRRQQFTNDLERLPLPELIDKHTCGTFAKKDIGVIGMWMTCNYGALLTTYGLYKTLKETGYDPILIDHSPFFDQPRYSDPQTVFRDFVKNSGMSTTAPLHSKEQFEELNDRVDAFMVASDQVWNYDYIKAENYIYHLDFAAPEKKKISCASSFGKFTDSAPISFKGKASLLLKRFDAVSVRENSAVDILKNDYDIEGEHLIDPVFLCTPDEYNRLVPEEFTPEYDDYLLTYILDPTPGKREALSFVSKTMELPLINILNSQFDADKQKQLLGLELMKGDIRVEEWLGYFKKCRFVVTDSFHGVCFALIYNKPFMCIANHERGLARFSSLLKSLKLEERMAFSMQEVRENEALYGPVPYDAVNKRISAFREKAIQWLQENLSSEKNPSTLIYDHMHQEETRLHEACRLLEKNNRKMERLLARVSDALDSSNHLASLARGKIRRRYYRYKLMAKITTGKRRRHYEAKRDEMKKFYRKSKSGDI